jgi:hypothetical protein
MPVWCCPWHLTSQRSRDSMDHIHNGAAATDEATRRSRLHKLRTPSGQPLPFLPPLPPPPGYIQQIAPLITPRPAQSCSDSAHRDHHHSSKIALAHPKPPEPAGEACGVTGSSVGRRGSLHSSPPNMHANKRTPLGPRDWSRHKVVQSLHKNTSCCGASTMVCAPDGGAAVAAARLKDT